MPDANGQPTIRDRYPIYCDVCRLKIHGGEYRTIGIYRDPESTPVSRYAHRDCLGEVKGVKSVIARPASEVNFVHCVYCGADTVSSEFVCKDCKHKVKHDLHAQPSDAVRQLLQRLSEIRHIVPDEAPETPQPKASGGHGGSNGGNGRTPEEKRETAIAAKKSVESAIVRSELHGMEFGHFVPTDESGVILMFGGVLKELGYRAAMMTSNHYPDAVFVDPENHVINVEFEFMSSNFISHGHDPNLCDMVVCWERNRELTIPVLELAQFYNQRNGTWDWREAYKVA